MIVCVDVLKHLKTADRVLARPKRFLAAGGYVVGSIPNVAHASVIAKLLAGRFRYRPVGLFDEGHLRWFTRDSIYQCFEQGSFAIVHLEHLRLEPEVTEFRTYLSKLPPGFARPDPRALEEPDEPVRRRGRRPPAPDPRPRQGGADAAVAAGCRAR